MYTITNTSTKIIHICSTVLLPDASMEAPESVAKLPSIQAFVKRGMLKIFTPADPTDGSNEGEAEENTAAEEPKTPADKPSRTSRSPRNSAKAAE